MINNLYKKVDCTTINKVRKYHLQDLAERVDGVLDPKKRFIAFKQKKQRL